MTSFDPGFQPVVIGTLGATSTEKFADTVEDPVGETVGIPREVAGTVASDPVLPDLPDLGGLRAVAGLVGFLAVVVALGQLFDVQVGGGSGA